VRHCLGLATRTHISVCKSPFPLAGTAVSLFRAKTVQQRPLLLREVEARLPDCGVTFIGTVYLDGQRLHHECHPAYLGVTLDRTLSYREHLRTETTC